MCSTICHIHMPQNVLHQQAAYKLLAVSSNEKSPSTKEIYAHVCVCVCVCVCSYSWITVSCIDFIIRCISMCTFHWNWYVSRKVLWNAVSLLACLGMGPLRWIILTKLTHILDIFHQLLLVKKHILEDGSTSVTENTDWLHLMDPRAYILFYLMTAAQTASKQHAF